MEGPNDRLPFRQNHRTEYDGMRQSFICPPARGAIPLQKIPRLFSHTKPTPPDESDTTEQVSLQFRMIPTPPDHSD